MKSKTEVLLVDLNGANENCYLTMHNHGVDKS